MKRVRPLLFAPILVAFAWIGSANETPYLKKHAPVRPAAPVRMPVRPQASSLDFEQNLGQTDAQVSYLARRGGTRVFITGHGAVLQTVKLPDVQGLRNKLGVIDPKKIKVESQAIAMTLTGGSDAHAMEVSEPLESGSSYYIGNNPAKWVNHAPHFGRVLAKSVYQGIDIAYYGHEGKLEYDLIVAPGADPNQIHLAFNGQKSMQVASNGDLVLNTDFGAFVQARPKVYQDLATGRVEVASAYKIDGGNVGFELARYDASKPLVIDPVLVGSTYFGGSQAEAVTAMSSTPWIPVNQSQTKYVVITGFTASVDFPKYNSTYSGGTDSFITILNPDNSSFYQSTYFGGSKLDLANSVSVDPFSPTVCAGGLTFSTDFPITQYAWQSQAGSGTTGFVTCFTSDRDHNVLYSPPVTSTYIGQLNTAITAVSFSQGPSASQSRLYIGGYAQERLNFNYALAGCYSSNNCTPGDDQDAIAGVFQYFQVTSGQVSLYEFGGTADDSVNAIAGSDTGFVAVGGTQSGDVPVFKPWQGSRTGTSSSLIFAYSPRFTGSETELMMSYFGGTDGVATANAVTIARGANNSIQVAMAGQTTASSWPVAGTPLSSTSMGGYDAFIVRGYVPLGIADQSSVDYASLFGGSADDFITGVMFTSGGVAAIGTTASPNLPVVHALPQGNALRGAQDAFVLRFLPNLAPDFATYLGGSSTDSGSGISSDGLNSIYVAGTTNSTDFPVAGLAGSGPAQSSSNGGADAFIARIYMSDTSNLYITSSDDQNHNSFSGIPVTIIQNSCGAPANTGAIETTVLFTCPLSPLGSVEVSVPSKYTDKSGIVNTFVSWADGSKLLDRTFKATFSTQSEQSAVYHREAPLKIAAAGTGTGTVSPASGSLFAPYATVNISATPASGSRFTGWTGATAADLSAIASPASANTTIVMNTAHSIAANFSKIAKANPKIFWLTPADVNFGSALGSTQLNASADVNGSFVYNPAAGTVLPAGQQTLSVTFTPADTATYNTVSASVKLNVLPPTTAGLVVSRTLTRVGADVNLTVSVANGNSTAAANVQLTTASFGAKSATPLPVNLGTIPAGRVGTATITLSGVASGSTGVLSIGGTFTGGTFRTSSRTTLP